MAFLGQNCALPPGEYELSVQFFGSGRLIALSGEKVQAFSIADNSQNSIANPNIRDEIADPDLNTGKKGVSININGFGIRLGGAEKRPACGKITAITRIGCGGRDPQTGLVSYNIMIILVNTPIAQTGSCSFMVQSVVAKTKGELSLSAQKLPLAIASTDTVSYTFRFTPASAKVTDAIFSVRGIWEGNAQALELNPELKLPACNDCGCGTWDNMTLGGAAGVATATSSLNVERGSKTPIIWSCGQLIRFASNYRCSSSVAGCKALTSWDIQRDGSSVQTGKGTNQVSDSFTPSGNGTYTITLNADCGDLSCPNAVYTLIVQDCQPDGPPNPPSDPPKNPVTEVPNTPVDDVLNVIVRVNIPEKDTNEKDKKSEIKGSFYYIIPSEYTGEIVNATDTLFLQIQNSYAPNTKQLNYTLRNLFTDKVSQETRANITNNQGTIRIALPLQNSIIAKGETGLLIVKDYKRYYYITFKRN